MPRTPIQSRDGFFKIISGVRVPLHWNLVETAIGAMLEPRQLLGPSTSPLAEKVDAVDAGFTRETEYNEDLLSYQHSTGGVQLLTDYGV